MKQQIIDNLLLLGDKVKTQVWFSDYEDYTLFTVELPENVTLKVQLGSVDYFLAGLEIQNSYGKFSLELTATQTISILQRAINNV